LLRPERYAPAPTKFVEEELAKARERIAQRLANLGKPVEAPKPATVNADGDPDDIPF